MQYAHRYLQYAITALKGYDGSLPLQHYLKQFFAADKKYGSKDRKQISQLCYCYFRLGHALSNLPVQERLIAAVFLCNQPPTWSAILPENWQPHYVAETDKRIRFLQSVYPGFDTTQIFPWLSECSEGIDLVAFANSLLVQPDVFIRIRPGYDKKVLTVLKEHAIPYRLQHNSGVAIQPNTKIEGLFVMNKEVIVQDLASQKVGDLLKRIKTEEKTLSVWDCCAASGGKSILAVDILKKLQLTVSDVRPSIIHTLKQRFAEAGIKQYRSFVADLASKSKSPVSDTPAGFDLIICDAPCTGSGTWGRTPEQLFFFKEQEIDRYATLQRSIASNAIQKMAPKGHFLYITCSVFKKENEDQVQHLLQQHGDLELVHQQLITGYKEKADSMFAALFTKKSAISDRQISK